MIKLSNNKLKVGVIGCGMIEKLGHLQWYDRSKSAEIVALADPDEKKLKKAAKKL